MQNLTISLISGIDGRGVVIFDSATNNRIQGNIIGSDITGSVSLGFQRSGVVVQNANGNLIGGTMANAGNLISGNLDYGVFLQDGANGTLVQGNYVGTDAAGQAALPNTYGLTVTQATGSTVGGAVLSARNLVSGNRLAGVILGDFNSGVVGAVGVTVQHNYIGTNAAGTGALGNGRDGVFVEVQSVTNTVKDNLIAYNGANGIRIPNLTSAPVPAPVPGFRINLDNNAIYSNAALGIDLGPEGITPNDLGDPDGGANLLQNFPILSGTFAPVRAAKEGTEDKESPAVSLNVNGTLNSTPNQAFIIQWYFSSAGTCGSNQNGPPLAFGRIPGVTTDANGNASFVIPLEFPPGTTSGRINATATDATTQVQLGGNTSEFGPCLSVTAPTSSSTVQFSAANFTASETGGLATLTVTRAGNLSAPARVDYGTLDSAGFSECRTLTGLADQRCDYTATSGTLTFAANETTKTIQLPILDDAFVEGAETLQISLANAIGTGLALGIPGTATVTISDDDTAASGVRSYAARFTGGQAVPANTSPATGTATLLLNEAATQATLNLSFSGLTGTQTNAQLRGPAPVEAVGPVLLTLPNGPLTNQTINLTPAQAAQLQAGLLYLNLPTTTFPNGEVRGQLLPNPLESARFFVRQQYQERFGGWATRSNGECPN